MRPDNRIVHGLWIGELSRLELLALHMFADRGHEFHLWRYEPAGVRLPKGVHVRDASEILPKSSIFRKREADEQSGLGAGSYATFSDMFRAKLLYEHGGIWADMDVLCLRPLDFEEPYVFRAHRVGAVMNLIKCPPKSDLMMRLVHESEAPTEESSWFGFTLAFYNTILECGLENFIRDDLMPADSWHSIQPLLESGEMPAAHWYAIHLLNELWNEVRRTGGTYKGQQITTRLPDKNHPIPGTTMFRWYERFGLYRRQWTRVPRPESLKKKPATVQPVVPSFAQTQQLNVSITSMALGGAERMVYETLASLNGSHVPNALFLLHDADPSYDMGALGSTRIVRTAHLAREEKMRKIGAEVAASRTPAVFAHLLRGPDYDGLSKPGARVVPVIHNAEPGWQHPAHDLNRPAIPFVVAVSEAVKEQLVAFGCTKPITVLRHELQRQLPPPEQMGLDRKAIRRRYNVPDDALLIGMVGQFKAQKMFTRAVRVLHALQEYLPARLMILGGWDHEWCAGRAAYTATCRQALDLGVMADLIMPGSQHPVDPFYAAFDVFLNVSAFEGLSIALLEAVAYGCPVVTAAAGGNAEALTANDRLVEDIASVDSYVDAILEVVAQSAREVPAKREDADLVPRLWSMLGAFGPEPPFKDPRSSVLIVTENLSIGGPQRSLTNLLAHWPDPSGVTVAVLDPQATPEQLDAIQSAGIAVIGFDAGSSLMQKLERTLQLAQRTGASTIAFWNVPPAFKLACAKVLEFRSLRLVDVSPGPMLFDELSELKEFPRRIVFSTKEYFERIDCFVAKYADGIPQSVPPSKCMVVRNGVPLPVREIRPPIPHAQREQFLIGTACRIAPGKHIEYLIDMLDILTQRMPNVTLKIAGAFSPRFEAYADMIADKVERAGLDNLIFAGPVTDINAFLEDLDAFVMISDDQGCPNASLEAMAMGLPVVANASGGTAEQIQDGKNGFFIDASSPRSMAEALERLLRDDDMSRRLGAAARRHAEAEFSMTAMVEGYRTAFSSASTSPQELTRGLKGLAHEDQNLAAF